MGEALQEKSVVAAARAWAERAPDRVLFTWLADGELDARPLTAGELNSRALAVAAALTAVGARGERVLTLCAPGLDFVVAFLGCLYAGAIAVPAAAPRRKADLTRALELVAHSGARFTILEDDSPWRADFAALTRVESVASLSATPGAGFVYLEPRPSDVAFLQYTSGSTGRPRGVIISHANLLHNSRCIHALRGDAHCVGVNWLPPYHDMGLVGAIVHPMHSGIHSVLMSPHHFLQRPVRWLEAVTRFRATASAAPDFALRFCVERVTPEQKQQLDLSSWQLLICGAEPVRHATWRAFLAHFGDVGLSPRILSPCYGLAESTLIVSGTRWHDAPELEQVDRDALEAGRAEPSASPAAATLVGCGQPMPGQNVAIVSAELEPLPAGQVGEIVVRGPSVAQGYFADPEASSECFGVQLADGSGPYLRTGDLGFLSEKGLFVVGRIKDLIKIRGRSLYASDIEQAALSAHPAVQPAGVAAFSIEDGMREELVVLAEIERSARRAPSAEILGAIREAVGRVSGVTPSGLALLLPSRLPRTSSGKLRRAECRKQWLAGVLDLVAFERLPT